LTEENVIEIRDLYESGIFQKELALRFGVSQSVISIIVLKQGWKHIN